MQWSRQKYRICIIAFGLLLFMMAFLPPDHANGNIVKLARMLPHDALSWGLYYGLALIACLRFLQPNLMALFILFNTIIMLKAHPWDRYVLPMVVAFWYFKSIDAVNQFPFSLRWLRAKPWLPDTSG